MFAEDGNPPVMSRSSGRYAKKEGRWIPPATFSETFSTSTSMSPIAKRQPDPKAKTRQQVSGYLAFRDGLSSADLAARRFSPPSSGHPQHHGITRLFDRRADRSRIGLEKLLPESIREAQAASRARLGPVRGGDLRRRPGRHAPQGSRLSAQAPRRCSQRRACSETATGPSFFSTTGSALSANRIARLTADLWSGCPSPGRPKTSIGLRERCRNAKTPCGRLALTFPVTPPTSTATASGTRTARIILEKTYGQDLSPLVFLIGKLRQFDAEIAEAQAKHDVLAKDCSAAMSKARAGIRQGVYSGMLSLDEGEALHARLPERYRPAGKTSLEAIRARLLEIDERRQQVRSVEAELQQLRGERMLFDPDAWPSYADTRHAAPEAAAARPESPLSNRVPAPLDAKTRSLGCESPQGPIESYSESVGLYLQAQSAGLEEQAARSEHQPEQPRQAEPPAASTPEALPGSRAHAEKGRDERRRAADQPPSGPTGRRAPRPEGRRSRPSLVEGHQFFPPEMAHPGSGEAEVARRLALERTGRPG